MIELNVCTECGVPSYITGEHLWLDNGDIVQSRDEGHRLVFMESENIDPLFRNIESIIGFSIESIVITAVRRDAREYVSLLIPDEIKSMIHNKTVDVIPIAHTMIDVAKMAGHGCQEIVGHRYESDDEDFYSVTVSEPFSVPMQCGTILGTTEAVTEVENTVTCEKLSEDTCKITTFPSPHPMGLKNRLQLRRYTRRPGNRNLARCATCGGPRAFSDYQWHLDRGIISNKASGRRMVIIGPHQLDVVFEELETELGDTIPKVVVEAQRRFAADGFYSLWDAKDSDDFADMLALRGLGNLQELKISRRGMRMRMENTVLHLFIVGMMQGVFDAAMDVESRVEWEYSEEGRLEMEVTPVPLRAAVRGQRVQAGL